MAQKEGNRAVWLNIGAPTKLISIKIEYAQSGSQILESADLSTVFTKGFFEIDSTHSSPGQHFHSASGIEPINGYDVPTEIIDYTVKYNFQDFLPETKALKIEDDARDFVSLTASFTDYELSAVVRPKMSQPGKSSSFHE